MKFLLLLALMLPLLGIAAPSLDEAPTFSVKQYTAKHGLGLIKNNNTRAFLSALPKHEVLRADNIPGKFDLTPLVSPPEDQGQCGSCWDFSLTKALRSALMLAGKDPGVLAFNYLLNNCGPGPRMYGCGGGDFAAGKSFENHYGPWLESQDPYTEREGRCKTGLPVAGTAIQMVQVGGDRPSFKELAQAVSQRHMLSIDVAVAGSWGSYAGGIYNGNGSGINHMINMNGYDCQTSVDAAGNCVFDSQGQPKNGDGFLIVMNNWGTSWGENGYMRTRWGRNEIATTAVYFDVGAPTPVDGGWSDWSEWTSCTTPSVMDQPGTQSHYRTCTNPSPANGGKDCQGVSAESRVCTGPIPPSPNDGIPTWATILMLVLGGAVVVLVALLAKKNEVK